MMDLKREQKKMACSGMTCERILRTYLRLGRKYGLIVAMGIMGIGFSSRTSLSRLSHGVKFRNLRGKIMTKEEKKRLIDTLDV